MKYLKAVILVLILTLTCNLAFADSLDDFPYNFLKGSNKLFTAKVVVGENASYEDTKSANSLINHLDNKFNLISKNITEITYGKPWKRLSTVQVSNFNNQLNLDETLKDTRPNSVNKTQSNIVLDDDEIELKSSRYYSQHIYFEDNGYLTPGISGENRGKGLLNFSEGNFISYELKLDESMDLTGTKVEDVIGKHINIMENNFIILTGWESVLASSTRTFDKFKMIRTDDITVIQEGEKKRIDLGPNSFNVIVEKVDDDNVDFIINNQEVNVKLQESKYIGNASIGVIDIGYSSSENFSNYAEILIGDIELILQDTKEVLINGEFASNVLKDNITVFTTMQSTLGKGWDGFKLTYRLTNEEGISLQKGDIISDPLFNAFKIKYTGSNYETFRTQLPDFESFVYADVELQLGKDDPFRDISYKKYEDLDDEIEFLGEEGYYVYNLRNFTKDNIIYDLDFLVNDSQVDNVSDIISVGGPAINSVTAKILNITYPSYESDSGVNESQAIIKYFENLNSIVVYGYDEADTAVAINRLKRGNFTTNSVYIG